jgi:hypothetical protein
MPDPCPGKLLLRSLDLGGREVFIGMGCDQAAGHDLDDGRCTFHPAGDDLTVVISWPIYRPLFPTGPPPTQPGATA